MTGRIQLKNMAFYGYHGVHPEEAALGQRFSLDLTFTIDIADAAESDNVADTVDYGRVYALVRSIFEEERCHLLETLAARVLNRVLDAFPPVREAAITLRKPSAPIAGHLDYVALETSLSRADRLPRAGQ